MFFLDIEQIVQINKLQIKRYGGSYGVRDRNLLGSSVFAPQNYYFYEVGGEKVSNSILLRVAVKYAFSIIKNHPFMDGNKRTGLASTIVFLELNDISINLNKKQAEDNAVKIATGEIDEAEYYKWLKASFKK